jgi:hypothetical protein
LAYVEQPGDRRAVPIALLGGGAVLLLALLPFGSKAVVAGAVVFFVAMVLAMLDSARPVFTWPYAASVLVVVIWFVPIKEYALPVSLPFKLEPYRLLLLVLICAWMAAVALRRGRLDAAGRGDPIVLLIGIAIASTILNYDDLTSPDLESPINPALYFHSFPLLWVLLASTIDRLPSVDQVLRVIVACATIVALFAMYESRTRWNFFDHLHEYVPILDRQERKDVALRAGQLRVQASAQHPIAFGVVLIMMIPLGAYLAKQASTALRARLWVVAALLCAMAAVTTVSRTTVMMLLAMAIVVVRLRGSAVVRYWPALLVLPVAIHFVAPGALGGLYKSFFPEEGLIGSVQGREGEGGSGRFSDIGPGLRLWTEEPVVGRGVGSETIFEPAVVRVGGAPPVPVIFDNQYMSTLVELGLLGFLVVVWLVWGTVFRLIRGARRSTGPPSDLLTACAVATAGFGTAMFFFDAFAFVQCTLVFVFVAVLGLRVAQLQRRRVPKLVERPVPAA